MRIPGFKAKKSGADDKGTPSDERPNVLTRSSSRSTVLSELGRFTSSRSAKSEVGASASSSAQSSTSKRSFFKRSQSQSQPTSSHSSAPSKSKDVSSTASSQPGPPGGHPLRQQTLPSDLTTSQSKRPGLGLPLRASSLFPLKTTAPSSQSFTVESRSRPTTSSTLASQSTTTDSASKGQDGSSFHLRSFRAVTPQAVGLDQQPTLSSLMTDDPMLMCPSPVASRPTSPSHSPSGSMRNLNLSYFEHGPAVPRERQASGSISVSKFRDAKAARSSSSVNMPGMMTASPASTSGLRLDLPPPIQMDYFACRNSADDLNTLARSPIQVNEQDVATPTGLPVQEERAEEAITQLPTEQETATGEECIVQEAQYLDAVPRAASSEGQSQYATYSSPASPTLSLAAHPDAFLPLPPVPQDPETAINAHTRRASTQSVASAITGWISASGANFSLPFSLEKVQQTISHHEPSSNTSPERKTKPLDHSEEPQEVLRPDPTPSKEDILALLGGKTLPPPPSETEDHFPPTPSQAQAPSSPQQGMNASRVLARATSFTAPVLGSAKNLFSGAFARPAKPARDDDDGSDSESSAGSFGVAAASPIMSCTRVPEADGDMDSDSDTDSDSSEVQRRKEEKARIFPPPRPTNEQERQQVYASAQASVQPTIGKAPVLGSPVANAFSNKSLTAAALSELHDNEEDENVPLIKLAAARSTRGAVSEVGLPTARSYPSNLSAGGSKPPPSRLYASAGYGASPGLGGRSLSNLSSTGNVPARQSMAFLRSSSAQGTRAFGSTQSSSVTLSDLIAAEIARDRSASSTTGRSSASKPVSGNNSSIETTPPKTPTDNFPLLPHGRASDHRRSASVPLASLTSEATSIHDKMKARHRAGSSGSMSGLPLDQRVPQGHAWPPITSPQAFQNLPPPPGVDPLLYASLPADQKLMLQQVGQQFMGMMQSYAMNAQQAYPMGAGAHFSPAIPFPPQPYLGGPFASPLVNPMLLSSPTPQQWPSSLVPQLHAPTMSGSISTLGFGSKPYLDTHRASHVRKSSNMSSH